MKDGARIVRAVHGLREIVDDPPHEVALAASLAGEYKREELVDLYGRFAAGASSFDGMMRRVTLRTLTKSFGHGVAVHPHVSFLHPETFEIGSGVFIGTQVYIQGRFDGRCRIGERTWIGPHAYFDARDLDIGSNVGWGPGAKVLGSVHTGEPADVPVIATDLAVGPVRIDDWADVGVNAVIMPGVTVGRGAIVGAGAVVTKDVPPFAKVAGVPAVVIGWRREPAAE